ncbi:MAG: M1 family metallopeptidase, partial [Bacteroidetes bacterium]|nr:M1 family metallopeptidase [Bacteroidota bacterium]
MKKMILKAAMNILFFAAFCFNAMAQKPYFQQEVNYKIEVKLDDQEHSLGAFIEMDYINNSPDELTFIYMHLWPNAYRHNETALAKQLLEDGSTKFHYADEKDKGFIDSLNFKINGETARWEFHLKHQDIAILHLSTPLKSGEKLKITTPFYIKIPLGEFSRMGHIGQQYQVTQWYPKPAVYDRLGWHPMPYLTQGEFYSEFGTFQVNITVPANYVVGATGDLQNEQELEWLENKARETEARKEFTKDMSFPPTAPEWKTLTYIQSNVHDFAWFADKRYHVLKGEVELPHSKRKVTLWSMFTNNEAKLWKNSLEYLHDGTYYYSLWNGDYPYNQVTAVDGALSAGAGMEYPTITVIGASGNAFTLENVIVHEVGHNWFYGILASNERQHPWLDEGINSFNELRYFRMKYPNAGLFGLKKESGLAQFFGLDYAHRKQYELMYLLTARTNRDQPIELPSPEYSSLNYGAIVYSKTAVVFDYLREYLGTSLFDSTMHIYFNTWKFKHPYPEDLRKIFEETTHKDLSWFFEDIINTTGHINYKIQSLRKVDCAEDSEKACYQLSIKNIGDIPSPIPVSSVQDKVISGTIWLEGFTGTKSVTVALPEAGYIYIDAKGIIPHFNTHNNFARTSGIFRKSNPSRLQFLGSIEHPEKKQVFFSPVLGYNNYNKFMPGIAFYNSLIPQKQFQYLVMPMYSFGTGREAGIINFNYNILPDKGFFRKITIGAQGEKFAINRIDAKNYHYHKLQPKISGEIRRNLRSPHSTIINFRAANIWEDRLETINQNDISAQIFRPNFYYLVNELEVLHTNTRKIQPYSFRIYPQQHQDFLRFNMEAKYQLTYTGKNNGVDFRLFSGVFLFNNDASPNFNFGMAGNT